jgi:hypothetical protein
MFDTINRESWHWKLYIFDLQMINAWTGEDFYYDEEGPKNIGLCPYMRTLFLWGPLIMMTNLIPWAAVIWSVIYFPTSAMGIIGPIMVVLGLALIFATIWCLGLLAKRNKQKRIAREEETARQGRYDRFDPKKDDDTFWKLIKDWIKTRKSKICPIMEVR